MRIVPFEEADEAAARACYAFYQAAHAADQPLTAQLSARVARHWLTEGWDGNLARTWYVPGDAPGGVLGACRLELPDLENLHRASLTLMVHPEHRRNGLGTALLRHAAAQAAADGRSVLVGSALRGSAGEAFARQAGGAEGIEEIVRQHDLRAIPDGLLQQLRETAAKAARDYTLISWRGLTPDERLGQVASVINALNDAPHNPGREDDIWDAQRARDRLNGPTERFGLREYSVAALHDGTGSMAALTTIGVDPALPEWGYQEITAVTRPHRGHRLGLLTKLAMLELLAEAEPQLQRIETMNAASNAHMIAINETLGYEVIGPPYVSFELPVASVPDARQS